jgi:DNA modification methylase
MELDKIYNEDCYKGIKKIPDKSIDLVYIDIPYLIDDGGCSDNDLSRRAQRLRNVELNDIRKGIDYSIFDELCRVMKRIYIYIYGVVKIKYSIF